MRKKKTIEEIKPAIELGNEYELLSEEYIGAHSKLEILHKFCGNVFQMSWSNFQKGQRCPGCSGKLKLTIEKIKPAIEVGDEYKLLSEEYINSYTKLEILHESCGDVFQMCWSDFQQGHRCPECDRKKRCLKLTLPFETIKTKIDSVENYKLLSDEYVNAKSKLKILHESCGDVFQMTWANFSQGQRCPKCWIKNNKGENHYNWNPNLTDEERENGRNCPENYQWRKAVLDRDNDHCQKCGISKNLEAHHILPWALFPELRFEVENGITFCKSCHDRYHFVWKHGKDCNPKTLRTHLLYNHETMEIIVTIV